MKEVIDAINTRFKSPYFGYSILAFFAWNWRGIFLLVATKGTPVERLDAFDGVTSLLTIVFYPLLVGALVAASTHWIRLVFRYVSRKPLELMDMLDLEAENKKTVRQSELEQSRSTYFAEKEKELIGRAKRDEEVARIEDTEAKEKLAAQLEALRNERDQLSNRLNNQELVNRFNSRIMSNEATEILRAAAENKEGTIIKIKSISGGSIRSGQKTFGIESSRDFARYEKALENLVVMELAKTVDKKGEVFNLTNEGWQAADELQ